MLCSRFKIAKMQHPEIVQIPVLTVSLANLQQKYCFLFGHLHLLWMNCFKFSLFCLFTWLSHPECITVLYTDFSVYVSGGYFRYSQRLSFAKNPPNVRARPRFEPGTHHAAGICETHTKQPNKEYNMVLICFICSNNVRHSLSYSFVLVFAN
jgi:hypothetical protein